MSDISQRYAVVHGVTKMIIELRNTEETFCELLQVSEKYYFKPMIEKGLITHGDELYKLLHGLVGIRKIGRQFLSKIKAEMDIPRSGSVTESGFNAVSSFSKNCSALWEIFSKSFNLFKLYSVYINAYNKEASNFGKYFIRGSPRGDFSIATSQVIKQKETTFHGGGFNAFDLPSILITPVQRLPRYKMLLQSMCKIFLKHKSILQSYSVECSKVHGALDLMNFICEYVNNKPKQNRSDETLKQIIRIKYWAEDYEKRLENWGEEETEEKEEKEKLSFDELKKKYKKEWKKKKRELEELREKLANEEDFVKKQLVQVFLRAEKFCLDFEQKVKKLKKPTNSDQGNQKRKSQKK